MSRVLVFRTNNTVEGHKFRKRIGTFIKIMHIKLFRYNFENDFS